MSIDRVGSLKIPQVRTRSVFVLSDLRVILLGGAIHGGDDMGLEEAVSGGGPTAVDHLE